MAKSLAVIGLADRIIKGILVTGFQNDAEIEKTLEEQRSLIEGSIARALPDLLAAELKMNVGPVAHLSAGDELKFSMPTKGMALDRMEPVTRKFLEAIGEVNSFGPLTGVSYLEHNFMQAFYKHPGRGDDDQLAISIKLEGLGASFPHDGYSAKSEPLPFMPHAGDNLKGCMDIGKFSFPMIGGVWLHSNGNLYEIRGWANEDGEKAKYPPMVEYKNLHTGKPYSGRLDDWHRRMTYVGKSDDIGLQYLPDPESSRWIESANANGPYPHFGVFIRQDKRHTVLTLPSSDGEVATCLEESLGADAGADSEEGELRWKGKTAGKAIEPVEACFRILTEYLESLGSAQRREAARKLRLYLGDL